MNYTNVANFFKKASGDKPEIFSVIGVRYCANRLLNSDLVFLWKQFDQLFEDFHIELGSVSVLDQRHKLLMGTSAETEQKN